LKYPGEGFPAAACGAYQLKICAGGTRALIQSAIRNPKSEIQYVDVSRKMASI